MSIARSRARTPKRSSKRSPAKVCPAKGCTVDDRIRWCMQLMGEGKWFGYVTRVELGEAWGVSEATVCKAATEASRRLAADPEDLEQARKEHAAFCARIQREALASRSRVTGLPDYASALKAAELSAKFKRIDLDKPAVAGEGQTRVEILVLPEAETDEKPEGPEVAK